MFGYIQPLKCELKMREYDYYRAAYCGLCNALRMRCGIIARFIVNYDFVFLSVLLSSATESKDAVSIKKRRCMVCPSGRKCIESDVFCKVADISVILTYLKLVDDVKDDTSAKTRTLAKIASFLLRSAYKKAVKNIPEYNAKAREMLDGLAALEERRAPSIDKTADKFATILENAVESDSKNSRQLKQILYHIGRFVYIIDALDDFEEDISCNRYNPIATRFSLNSAEIGDSVLEQVLITLEQSRVSVLRAFELLDESDASGILRNIIEYGMPAAVSRVTDKKENKRNARSI